jgi:monofunctional biosynthetic peptidoglycan transglycosylase
MPQTARASTKRPAASTRRKRGGIRRLILRGMALLALVAVGFWLLCCTGLVLLKWINPITTTVQMERRIEALTAHQQYHKRWRFVPLSSISLNLQHAVVAAEDARFYRHHGIDWQEVDTVVQQSLEEGEVTRGASTITQQLVKNLFATTARNPLRKALEFTLAPVADRVLGKQRTLELYLNVIEWGPGVYGAEAASEYYYNKPASALTRDEASRLAAILPAPRRRKPARMSQYSEIIQTRMRQMNW